MAGMAMSFETLYADRTRAIKHSDVARIFAIIEKGDVISLAGGLPDPNLLYLTEIQEVAAKVLREIPEQALQYCPTPGLTQFREFVAQRAGERSVLAGVENTIITGGALQAFDYLCRLLLEPGDEVITEAPTYLAIIHTVKTYSGYTTGVPMDEHGMRTDLLAQILSDRREAGKMPKFIYVIPNFHNPTGLTLAAERRSELVRLGAEYGVPIIEDDAYGELQLEGEPQPLLKSLDETGGVIFLGTFSKIFCPGVRLGWMIAEPELVQKMILVKQANDQCPNSMGQKMIQEFGEKGLLAKQIIKIRHGLGRRRLVMQEALQKFFPPGTQWTNPQGGYFTWATLPGAVDTEELLPTAVDQWRAAYVPGCCFFPDRSGPNTLRLSYSLATEEAIQEGISRLGEMFGNHLAQVG